MWTCSLDWWWDCCLWWEQVSAPHLNRRYITHPLVLPHQWGGTVSTAADTDRHTHHSPAHPTDSHSLLQFTPLLPTTTPTPAPLGRPSAGEMVVMVSLDLLEHQDLQGYLVSLEHPVWQQSTYIMFSHPLQTCPLP